MPTDLSVPAVFLLDVPGKANDPVMDQIQVGEDRVVSIRINERGCGMLGFLKKYDPIKDSGGGEINPCATARFNGDDLDHMVTEISLSPEALLALKVLLDRHVK